MVLIPVIYFYTHIMFEKNMYNQLMRTLNIKNPSMHTIKSLEHALKAAKEFLKKPLETSTKEDISMPRQ
jgi:hypothetical protein